MLAPKLALALQLSAAFASDLSGMVAMKFERNHVRHSARLTKRSPFQAEIDQFLLGGGFYYVKGLVGTPGQQVALDLDTGSSDLWMFGPHSCVSSTSACLGGYFDPSKSNSYTLINQGGFQITYVTANSGVEGNYFSDNYALGGITLKNITMGMATDARHVNTGIMGIGFDTDESSSAEDIIYNNVIDEMFVQGVIQTRSYSLYLDDLAAATGVVLFGGYDTDKFIGNLAVLDIQPDAEQGTYTSMSVIWNSLGVTDSSGSTLLTPASDGSSLPVVAVLDSGTAITYIPDDMFQTLAKYFGAVNDQELGYLVSCDLGRTSSSVGSVNFGFGDDSGPIIAVPFAEFSVPMQDPTTGNLLTDQQGKVICRFGLGSINEIGGAGADYLIGDTFLRSAYVVYDLDALQIGMAQTRFDTNATNIKPITAGSTGVLVGATSIAGAQTTIKQTATGASFVPGAIGSDAATVLSSAAVTASAAPVSTGLGRLPGVRTTYNLAYTASAAKPLGTVAPGSSGGGGSGKKSAAAPRPVSNTLVTPVAALLVCGLVMVLAL